jgi:hypothetical protein
MKNRLKKMTNMLFGGAIAFTTDDFADLIVPTTSTDMNPQEIVVMIINYSLFFIGALALIFVIWGGIQYVTSGGDAEKTTKARNTLLYAIIGVVVVVLAYGIVNWAASLGGKI